MRNFNLSHFQQTTCKSPVIIKLVHYYLLGCGNAIIRIIAEQMQVDAKIFFRQLVPKRIIIWLSVDITPGNSPNLIYIRMIVILQ